MFSHRSLIQGARLFACLSLTGAYLGISGAMVPAAPIRQPVFQEPSLIPAAPSAVPDYFCTWNIQGYTCSYESSSQGMRRELNETNLFGTGKSPGWLNFYPRIRADLIFVMDDSWDVPLSGDSSYFGSLILNEERFPSYSGTPAERLKKLTATVKARGWKGLGGWICAQPAPKFAVTNEPDYWTERLHWMREAGFAYWKVDWGQEAHNASWRQMITGIAHQEAPALIVEHAMTPEALKFADVYRTYDVENVMSVAVTIDRVAQLIRQKLAGSPTLINCEDEPYIAAGLGCLIGVMRHPHAGPLPDGKPDFVFPVAGRNLKSRLDEVVRAVRWHRIAAPMALGATADHIDAERLKDTWRLEPNETYTAYKPGDWREASAPARVTRGLALPEIKVGAGELTPFVLASRATNGAVAIATIGRTVGRQYQNPRAAITLDVENARGPFGIFGVFGSLTLKFDHPLPHVRILAQDLAADYSTDITADVLIRGNELTLSGELISKIGLSAASANDLSEPGLVLVVTQ